MVDGFDEHGQYTGENVHPSVDIAQPVLLCIHSPDDDHPGIPDMNIGEHQDTGLIRQFATGATRDSEQGKYDYEGFLSPVVLERFGAYMDQHRKQSDGTLRESDNWQKGISRAVYMKSAWRHFFAWWKIHRGGTVTDERDGHRVSVDEAICGLLFNTMGYLHEAIPSMGVA